MKKICKLLIVASFATVALEAATKTFKYKVKSGDTLYSIAKKNHTTVSKVCKVNAIKKTKVLKLGKVIRVPTQSSTHKKRKKSSHSLASSLSKQESIKLSKTKVIKSKRSSSKFALSDMFTSKSTKKSKKMTSDAKKKLGKRYVWGASGRGNTYDCSSFTKYVYRKSGIEIPRTSIRQSKYGKKIARKNLKKGDLIFFDTSKRRKGYVNHVGMYIGNNQFIHASSAKHKVIITSLNKKFYSQRFKCARRPS